METDSEVIERYCGLADEEYREYIENSWWSSSWWGRRKTVGEVLSVLGIVGIILLGFAGLFVYINIWIGLWYLTGWPWWIFVILGIGCWLLMVVWMRRNRKCEQCGTKKMQVLDTVYDAGYSLYDILRCGQCGHSQRG